jgi:hypothetical protein
MTDDDTGTTAGTIHPVSTCLLIDKKEKNYV